MSTRVRIERDETRYRSKGNWPQFRGRTGTVVQANLGEYGVVFGKVTPRTDGRGTQIRGPRLCGSKTTNYDPVRRPQSEF
jgi:hypothetical protein